MPRFSEIIAICAERPTVLVALLPSLALMLVNGWTDAPVNIATAIRSGAVKPNLAIVLSAVCNFLGATVMCLTGGSVAVSIYSLSGLSTVSDAAIPALTAAIVAVVVWSLAALIAGLPTSESHALFAGLSGAAVAVSGVGAVNGGEWLKVLSGLVLSTLPVAVLTYFSVKLIKKITDIGDKTFKKLQLLGAMLSSFAHGAQDGQKFAGILTLTAVLTIESVDSQMVTVPLWTALVSAVVISLGTLLGGRKIIKRFSSLAPTDPAAGFASDLISSISLTLLSVLGLPASTTHAKSSAVIGAGKTDRHTRQDRSTLRSMLLAWGLTFPITAVLGFVLAKLFT